MKKVIGLAVLICLLFSLILIGCSDDNNEMTVPEIAIESPESGALIETEQVKVEGVAFDYQDLEAVYVGLKGEEFKQADGLENWSIELTVSEGKQTIQAYGEDSLGNQSEIKEVIIEVELEEEDDENGDDADEDEDKEEEDDDEISVGHFQIEGNQVLTPQGEPFVGVGANIEGPKFQWSSDSTKGDFVTSVIDDWNLNIVRVNNYAFSGETDAGQAVGDGDFTLDELIELYTSRHVVVMVSLHDFSGGLFDAALREERDYGLDELIQYWTEMAEKYGDNPYVWFNIMRGPGAKDSDQYYEHWLTWHKVTIDAIREAGAGNLIVADGMYWGQDAGAVWDQNRTEVATEQSAILSHGRELLEYDCQENILFSFNAYDQWATSNHFVHMVNKFIEEAFTKELALFVGEWGSLSGVDHQQVLAQHILALTLPQGVGATVWHAQPGDGFVITKEGGGLQAIDSTENPSNLTWWQGEPLWMTTNGPLE